MKILLVTENLGSGGAERQLVGLAQILLKFGHEPVVITWLDRNFYAETLKECGIKHILLSPKNKMDRIWKLSKCFRRERPHAVISYLPMANITCALASYFHPVKLIVSERSFTTNWGLKRKITNFLYRRASHIVANSNNEAENIRKHCPELSSKTIAISNFVDLKKFKPVSAECSIGNVPLKMIGVGRVIPSKNILRLIRALKIVKDQGYDFEFEWFGSCSDINYRLKVETLISQLSLGAIFKLMGECPNVEMAYNNANLFVMPSLLEGYPNVLIEAMASGLPVAASNVCEHPHIITSGENGYLFNPLKISEMACSIVKLLDLTMEQYKLISRANRIKVEKNNSEESFYKRYISIL